jgi:hypothetical protein
MKINKKKKKIIMPGMCRKVTFIKLKIFRSESSEEEELQYQNWTVEYNILTGVNYNIVRILCYDITGPFDRKLI